MIKYNKCNFIIDNPKMTFPKVFIKDIQIL